MSAPNETWQVIPGTEDSIDREEHRIYNGILSLYVGRSGKRGPNGHYRDGFDHRWTIWVYGSLLGEGFTDDIRAARSACEQEADRVEWRIRDAIKPMDIRANREVPRGPIGALRLGALRCTCTHRKLAHLIGGDGRGGTGACPVPGCACQAFSRE